MKRGVPIMTPAARSTVLGGFFLVIALCLAGLTSVAQASIMY